MACWELKSPVNASGPSDIIHHLQDLQHTIKLYFPPAEEDFSWLRNPFTPSAANINLGVEDPEQVADIRAAASLKDGFSSTPFIGFGARLKEEFPEISNFLFTNCFPF